MKTKMSEDDKEFTFSSTDEGVTPNLGANSVTDEGVTLFPSVGKKISLLVKSWDMGFADEKTGKTKPILQLEMDNGDRYQRVLGANMKKKIGKLGIKKPDELIGKFMLFEKYDTKSNSPKFRWGLRLVAITEKRTLE